LGQLADASILLGVFGGHYARFCAKVLLLVEVVQLDIDKLWLFGATSLHPADFMFVVGIMAHGASSF